MKFLAKCLLCLLIFSLVLPATAFAKGTRTYTIEDMGLKLNIPTDLIVLTRDMAPDDPALKRSGYTADEWAERYHEFEDLYMLVLAADGSFYIEVTMETNYSSQMYYNYADLPADKMKIAESVKRAAHDYSSIENFTIEQYRTPQVTYLEMNYKDEYDDGSPYNCIEYQTYYGGRDISLSLYCDDGPAAPELKDLIRRIVDTAVYTSPGAADSTAAPSAAPRPIIPSSMGGTHAIPELGLTLTIPDDLVVFGKSVDPKDRNLMLLDANADDLEEYHFEEGIYLDAIETDWAYAIEAALRTGEDAEAFKGVSSITPDVMQDVEDSLRSYYGSSAKKLEFARYETSQAVYLRVSYQMPQAESPYCVEEYFTLYDGQVICLRLSSYTGPVTPEQQKLLKTVVDTAVFDSPAAPAAAGDKPSVLTLRGDWTLTVDELLSIATKVLLAALSIVLTILLFAAPIVIYRYAKSRKARPVNPMNPSDSAPDACSRRREQGPAMASDIPVQDAAPTSTARYCIKCGSGLSPGSVYCSACGAKITKDTV